MKYLVVVPVEAYALGAGRGAIESAFAEHLRQLLARMGPSFDAMTVATVGMPEARYAALRDHLGVLDPARDRIRVELLYDAALGHAGFARALPSIRARLDALVRDHDLVHAGPSHDLRRPVTTMALAAAVRRGKPTISVTDIDLRSDAAMNRKLGRWSLKSYLLCRYLYDPIRHLQHRWVARRCSLVLFKSEAQRVDYGAGRPNVRMMRDPGFGAAQVIAADALAAKIARVRDSSTPLEAIYFGRLVEYKGVDRCVDAVARARALGRDDLRLTIMGHGEGEAALRRQVAARGLDDRVTFRPPVPYDDRFFEALRRHHLLLAAPLSNDTPRSAWDAMASGMPILAFGTDFYRDLEATTGAVETVPWPSTDALGDRLAALAADRDRLARRMERAARVAHENTGEAWLARRVAWTKALLPPGARGDDAAALGAAPAAAGGR